MGNDAKHDQIRYGGGFSSSGLRGSIRQEGAACTFALFQLSISPSVMLSNTTSPCDIRRRFHSNSCQLHQRCLPIRAQVGIIAMGLLSLIISIITNKIQTPFACLSYSPSTLARYLPALSSPTVACHPTFDPFSAYIRSTCIPHFLSS